MNENTCILFLAHLILSRLFIHEYRGIFSFIPMFIFIDLLVNFRIKKKDLVQRFISLTFSFFSDEFHILDVKRWNRKENYVSAMYPKSPTC